MYVAVVNGKIAGIGRLDGGAKRTLDVDGLAVAPGFIDPHTFRPRQTDQPACSRRHGFSRNSKSENP